MKPAGPFTSKLWITVQPVYKKIIQCPFVRRLADGTLPRKWFTHYLSQDILYIIDDSRALAVTAARAENPEEMYFFLQIAKDGLDIERTLHDEFVRLYDICKATEKSPAFKAYADFLTDNAFNSPYSVAVAALLPCFWIYHKTGKHVLQKKIDNNPYRKWIETYSGDEYIKYTRRFIHITENLGQKADRIVRKEMENAFTEGTKHELSVFEEASSIE